MSRTCYRCKEEKSDGDFYRDRGHPTGFQRQCKECKKSRQLQIIKEKREAVQKSVTAKTCKKCGEIKPLEDFPIHSMRRDGRGCSCEKCLTPPPKKEKPPGRQPMNPANKICAKCDDEKSLENFQKRYDGSGSRESQCKSCRSSRPRKMKRCRQSLMVSINRELIKAGKKQCSKCMKPLALSRFRKGSGSGGRKESCKKCIAKIPNGELEIWGIEKFREKKNRKSRADYVRERERVDPLFKMRNRLRSRTAIALKSKGWHKKSPIKKILGAPLRKVKAHLENQFTEGMTWDNHGDWHIDHIVPLASALTEEQILKLAHYSNLQPLWAVDNLRKGSKIA